MYVNPARVWLAKARRGMSTKELAEAIGEKPATVAMWIVKDYSSLDLRSHQIDALAFALHFPREFFTGGDEEKDFDRLNDLGRQLFGDDHKELGEKPCRCRRPKTPPTLPDTENA